MAVSITRTLMSGFTAYDDSRLKQVKQPAKTMIQTAIEDNARTPDYKNFYDEEISNLCCRYYKTPKLLDTIEFREEILAAWKRIFDGSSIAPWFILQDSTLQTAYVHQRYLVELICHVYDGSARTLSNTGYRRILVANINEDARQQKAADDRKNVKFKTIQQALDGQNTTVSAFLAAWSRKKEGFADMVEVLDVIFGLRQERTVLEQ